MAEEATDSWEPKTVSLEELKYAREAALYVLSTHSSEEAVRIFTHGLKPVREIKKNFMREIKKNFMHELRRRG